MPSPQWRPPSRCRRRQRHIRGSAAEYLARPRIRAQGTGGTWSAARRCQSDSQPGSGPSANVAVSAAARAKYPTRAVVDIQHADIGLPSGDDLLWALVEAALMKRALDLFVTPQIAIMYSSMAALCSW